MDSLQVVYPFSRGWLFGYFWFGAIMNKASQNKTNKRNTSPQNTNFKGEKNNFTVKKPGRQHHNEVIKVNNEIHQNHLKYDRHTKNTA